MQRCLKNTADKLLCGLDVVKIHQNHSNRHWGPSQTITITSQTIATNLLYFSALRAYGLLQGIKECVYLVHHCSPRPEQQLAQSRHSINVYWKKMNQLLDKVTLLSAKMMTKDEKLLYICKHDINTVHYLWTIGGYLCYFG